ncbi:MAG: hypothetical protein CMO80_05200 [Verrucomicrobiales bacterium]|nr:hypothetical protein [Verrucomicrobiales bacterium]|tara:strand:+ start:2065 stop:3384 length:1320 start_codon:yes stop_codon:yes gene_type:complete
MSDEQNRENNPSDESKSATPKAKPSVSPLLLFVIVGALLVGLNRDAIIFNVQLSRLVKSEAPSATVARELILAHGQASTVLTELWNTGRILHRRVATDYIEQHFRASEIPDWAFEILLESAYDRDYSNREIAIRKLAYARHPEAEDLLVRQLRDADPQLVGMALDMIRGQEFTNALPAAATLLTNPEPSVVARVATTIQQFTGKEFGITLDDIVLAEGAPEDEVSSGRERFDRAVDEAQSWWKENGSGFPALTLPIVPKGEAIAPPIELVDKDMHPASLAKHSGKPVLLCFFASWCPSCTMTIPNINGLHGKTGEAVLIGVSLDAIPDEHNHFGEDEEDNHAHHGHHHHHHHGEGEWDAAPKVKKSHNLWTEAGVPFPILFDVTGTTTLALDGGEIPTFALLDADRRLVRRFTGIRSTEALQAIVARHFPAKSPSKARE